MISKEFNLDGQFKFTVTKRKSSRHMKISLSNDGQVRVSIPRYLPYSAAVSFVKSRANWIIAHRPQIKLFQDNMPLGKSHHLKIARSDNANTIQSRIVGNEARLVCPGNLDINSQEVQTKARELAKKAYKIQARALLPQRVRYLAERYGFKYNELRFRDLKSRWGSCDRNGNITLSIKLMELPWDLIDYVIIHELNHTKHLNHSRAFWDNFKSILPNVMEQRKELKKYRAGV